jgi:hypothetical protein
MPRAKNNTSASSKAQLQSQFTSHFWLMLMGMGAVYLLLLNAPMAAAQPVSYSMKRNDKTASQLMKRGLQTSCNNTVQNWLSLGTVTGTPYFANDNGTLITTSVGPTGTAYSGVIVNSFDTHDNPENNPTQVDANTFSVENNYVIPTPLGPLYCWDTITTVTQAYCVTYYNGQPSSSIMSVPYYKSYDQRRVGGLVGPNDDYVRITYESNAYDGNINHFQIVKRNFNVNPFTPIDIVEVRVSTNINANNIRVTSCINPDNSGFDFWQRTLNGVNDIVMRGYNGTGFFPAPEQTMTNTTLPHYDCLDPKAFCFPDGSAKISFYCAQNPGGRYDLFIQNLNIYPVFQFTPAPVNLTGNLGLTFTNSDYAGITRPQNGVRFAISARQGGITGVLRAIMMDMNAGNTLDSVSFIDPNLYPQFGMTIVDRGNNRTTIGYQGNGNALFQTFTESPFINTPSSVIVNEKANNQTVTITGCSVAQTTYPQTQITVTATVPANIMILSTTATLPAGASVNYDAATGTLTLTTSGTTARTDMDNLLCGMQGTVQAYERQSTSITITISDNSGLPTYITTLPVNVVTENFVPFLHSVSLNIGQNNRSHFIIDVTTQDLVPQNQIFMFITNTNPSAADIDVNGTITQNIAIFTMDQINMVYAEQLGGNNSPQFTASASSYNGTKSASIPVNVNFFPTPQLIIRQITYNAKNPSDRTPVPITNANFEVTDSNSPASEQVFLLTYNSDSHGAIYRKGDFSHPITTFTQADANNVTNPVLYFIPDGSGKDPSFMVSFSDGYNTLPAVPVSMQYTIAPAPVKITGSSWFSPARLIESIIVFVAGRQFAKMLADGLRHRNNKFANFVRNHGSFGYPSFDTNNGAKFAALIDKLATKALINQRMINRDSEKVVGDMGVAVNGVIDQYLRDYNFFIRYIPFYETKEEKELKKIALVFSSVLKSHKDIDESRFIRLLMFIFLGGLPLKKDILDLEKSSANIDNMAGRITSALAGQDSMIVNSYYMQLLNTCCGRSDASTATLSMMSHDSNASGIKMQQLKL